MRSLRSGATVALVHPGSRADAVALQAAISGLESQGFSVKTIGADDASACRTSSGDRQRAEHINAAFADPEVDAIICVRGGYGSARIVDLLNYETIAANRKIFVGYSDITSLLIPLFNRAGLISFHGPVGVELFRNKKASSRQLLYEVLSGKRHEVVCAPRDVRCISAGATGGILMGGNLTVLSTMVGTAGFHIPPGAILFIEDVNECMYQIDRSLTHLARAGVFEGVAGIIFGESIIKDPGEDNSLGISLEEMLHEHFGGLHVPVVYGVPIGHTDDQITLPVGVRARLQATAVGVTLNWDCPFMESDVRPRSSVEAAYAGLTC